ncbi:lipoprotein B [Methylophaga frappieri]|uniref:Lipoprotein B n=1 Tax=Methylophaga frappieri (strain ATCC BAA-2434 / DSM 25690 / JAM7) TaxID=754477 RepID=I1YHY4_METFJ|nr:YqaA family protein [Methylophaga frappieri]AFJ02527.1 lipoprotein B [Methylophaga frappieri]
MKIFSSLYARTMQWARHRYASVWLAIVSFTESSFFLVPPDVMLAPMSLAQPKKAWFYAALTTVMSVAGGLLGYVIGQFALELVQPWLVRFDYLEAYLIAQGWFEKWGFWAIFLAGFTPIPYKIFTIAAGAVAMPLLPFILGSLVGRGSRFFLVAALMRWGGEALESRLHQWMDWLGWLTVAILVFTYFLIR